MRHPGTAAHVRRFGDLTTPCWCEREAKPIAAEMVARGETWSCSFNCYMSYVARLRRRTEVRQLVKR